MPDMTIAVFGATGKTGRCAVAEGVHRGHRVIAMVRAASAGGAAFGPGVEVRVCDVYEGLGDQIAGCDAVLSCIGIRRRNPLNPWSPLRSPRDTARRCTANIAHAMAAAGISRFACVSAAGAGESRARAAWPVRVLIARSNLGPAYADLASMEQFLSESRLDWLAVRPTTLTSGRRVGSRVVDRYAVTSRIPRASVAAALVDFADGAWNGPSGTVMISGA